ncbi:MAG: hypothetical protein KAS66_04005 [Candidatus Omnitrophica bacterium]|nr:hypothetical protein [Candidatus Omnitrophota bacterium]
MKSLTFIHIEDSRVDYTKLFDFGSCTVNFAKTGNVFSFDKYVIKSTGRLKLEDFIFTDKNDNLYLIGRKICVERDKYLVDLSGISDEQIGQVMDRTTNYVNGIVYGVEKWSVMIPQEHEKCIFRDDTVLPMLCQNNNNVFRLCDKNLCPIRNDTE